jgi:uncharacterized protein YcgL (UPF0745 family)
MRNIQIVMAVRYKVRKVVILCLLILCFSGCSNYSSENSSTSDISIENQQLTEVKDSGEDGTVSQASISKSTNEQVRKMDNSEGEIMTNEPWIFGETDLYINNRPVLNSTYAQLIKDFGTPKTINKFKVNPPAAEDDVFKYLKVLVYDGFQCELSLGEQDREEKDNDKVKRFDITNNNVELDCGLKVGMTTDEILNKFGKRSIYNIGDASENYELSAIKHVLKSYKPKDYYSGYPQAMIIDFDPDKFDESLAKALVLLIKNDKVDRIIFGYPTAD